MYWSFVLLFEVICALLPSKTDTLLVITDSRHLLKDVYSQKSTGKDISFHGELIVLGCKIDYFDKISQRYKYCPVLIIKVRSAFNILFVVVSDRTISQLDLNNYHNWTFFHH